MRLSEDNRRKIEELKNPKVMECLNEAIELCKPAKVTVITDSEEDIAYIRELSLKNGEEAKLAMEGHTIHFDGIYDLARDKKNTKYLVTEKVNWGMEVNSIPRDEGIAEIREIMDGIMEGKEMLVSFFLLVPRILLFRYAQCR